MSAPGTKEEGRTREDHGAALDDTETTNYRSLGARCTYLAPDRLDIGLTVKELARAMTKPTRGDVQKLKGLGRYLKGKPRLLMQYKWQPSQTTLMAYSDADWAGCRETRKSTTGGCIKIGDHCTKGWSKRQSLIALSSGESEFDASLKVAAEALGLLSMLKDLGWKLHEEVWGGCQRGTGYHKQEWPWQSTPH